jgi:hypothetical protein
VSSAIVFLFFCFTGGALADPLGDVNGDGVIDLKDTIYTLQVIKGLRPSSVDCSSMFNDLYSYAQQSTTACNTQFNAIYVKMVTNRNDSKYAFYAEGWLSQKNNNPSSLSGDLTQQFSDRTEDIACYCGSGDFITESVIQNFTQSNADILGVNISNNNVTFTLKSWGNGTYSVPLTCRDGMMFGVSDGVSYTFSFAKKVYQNVGCVY